MSVEEHLCKLVQQQALETAAIAKLNTKKSNFTTMDAEYKAQILSQYHSSVAEAYLFI